MAERRRPRPRSARVVRTERLSASLVRVVVAGDEFADFAPEHADSYVKVLFLHPDGTYPSPFDMERVRAELPAEHWPRLRTYTVRAWDPATRELTLDFVVHGDAGLAGPWAAAAQPGDEVLLQGPGGGYTPSPDAAFHLLAGDESALPAIAVALESMPAGAVGQAFVEVHGPGDELPLEGPAGVTLTWLHRGAGELGSRLVEAVTTWPVPEGEGQWFVHGEAGVIKQLRRHLRVGLGLPLSQLSISGYWRLGVDDEGWRAVKRDWNQEVEQSEASLAS